MDSKLLAELATNFYGSKFSGSSISSIISSLTKYGASEHKIEISKINVSKCNKTLLQLKLLMIKIDDQTKDFVLYTKFVYEIAAMLAVAAQDFSSFERYYVSLQDIYLQTTPDFTATVIIGLELFHLLTSNRIGEFHSLLELYPQNIRTSKMLSYVIGLENLLIDGDFNRLLANQQVPPIGIYTPFISILKDVTRYKVAACIECSFPFITATQAAKMLHLNTGELDGFIKNLNQTKFEQGEILWTQKNGRFIFESLKPKREIPVWETLQNTISYATQIERIV